jgi:hypothetical protein
MSVREEEGDWDPPTWAAEPLAWVSCLTNAVLPTVIFDAVFRALIGQAPAVIAFAVYIGVFSVLVWALKPWAAGYAR